MKTTDIIIYGALIYLFYKIKNINKCNCNQPNLQLNNNKKMPLHIEDITPNNIFDCGIIPSNSNEVINLPKFNKVFEQTIDAKQIIPTPGSILSPEQLQIYNASLKGINQNKYVC